MRMCDLAVAAAAVAERADPPPRRSRPDRARRARRPSDDDRRVMLAVLTDSGFDGARGGGPDPRRQRPPARSSTTSTPIEIAAMGDIVRRRSAPRSTPTTAGPAMTALPAGLQLPRRQRRHQGRHRRLRRRRRRRDRAPPPACSPAAASPGRACTSAASTSPTAAARAIVVVSKNANVATGAGGLADARELVAGVAARLGCDADRRARRLDRRDRPALPDGPHPRRHRGDARRAAVGAIADAAARGDHDHRHRRQGRRGDGRRRAGPRRRHRQGRRDDRARHGDDDHGAVHRRRGRRRRARPPSSGASIDRTFNCVSIDTDTSTSDTAVVLASGAAGPVDADEFETALHEVAVSLTKQIARDGEGAETLIEVHVDGARDARPGQAGRQGDRQLAARQDRRARRRPELGPGGDGDRQVQRRHRHRPGAGRDPLRRHARCTRRRSTTPGSPSCPTYLRGDEVLIHVSLGTGDADGHRVGLRPHRRLRPHQRRLHDLNRLSAPGAPDAQDHPRPAVVGDPVPIQ